MNCENCQSDLWIEQTAIRLAASPALDPRFRSTAKEKIYRLVCADCGAVPGELDEVKNSEHRAKNSNERSAGNGTNRNRKKG